MSNSQNILKILFLYIPACLYGIIVKIRNYFYDNDILKSKSYDIPIICVGNLTVGGTGKTPHTQFIINYLKDKKVAVLSRGYKRKTKGFFLVETTSHSSNCGDEPLLIKRNFPSIPVAVCENRCNGVEKLLELYPNLETIILDDGFQHRHLKPSISVLLNNYNRQYNNDFFLPYGRLRDCKSAYKRANYIIFTKCPENLSIEEKNELIKSIKPLDNQQVLFSYIKYNSLINIDNQSEIILSELKNFNILLVTGIAEPKTLLNFLTNNSKSLKHLQYTDHHNFKTNNINEIFNEFEKIELPKIVVITEKDAIKFAELNITTELAKLIYYLPIKIEF